MISPITTIYKGLKFRSRLEARWAVFFELMGIEYLYEPEGFVLNSGRWYLPDFYLPEDGQWIEVKGSANTINSGLLEQAGRDLGGLLILGPVPFVRDRGTEAGREMESMSDPGWPIVGIKDYKNDESSTSRYGFNSYHKNGSMWWNGRSPAVMPWTTPAWNSAEATNISGPAYRKARSAQFEHGVKG